MSEYKQAFAAIAEEAQVRMARTHAAREQAFPSTRQTIHLCASAIRAAHRREYDESLSLLQQAQDHLDHIKDAVEGHPAIYHAGYVTDAQKEYAEAHATLAFLSSAPLKGPDDLGVEIAPYLNGLAEAASELRRSILDALRRDDITPCEEWMETMDDVYSLLIAVDFPDAITGGLRRTTDQLRGVLERTRGDLTLALRQHSLERKLAEFQNRVNGPN
ncbi:MAG: haloacid dehalogenase [Dehalococcoidia bacterium]